MASNDLKNSFAERIKKRKESMTQAKAVEDSNSSTTQAAKTKSETKTAKSETQASFEDRITKRRSKLGMDTEVDDSFISSFISDANAYLNNAHSSYNSLGYSNAASTYDSTVDSVVGLRSRYGAITRYLKNNKDQLDPGYYDELSSNLETFIQSLNQYQKTFYDAKNFYAQWDSEEEYTAYLAEEEERAQRLAKLTGGYDPAKNWQEGKDGLEKYLADKEAESKAETDKTWWEKVAESYAYSSADTSLPAASLSNVTNMYRNDTTYREPDERWSEEQRNIYGYLYSQNPNKAWDYAIEINNTLNAKEQNKAKEKVTESATGSVGSGAAHTLGALLTAPLGLADYLDNLAELAGRGTITQKGGDVLTPFDYSQTVTGGISQELNEKYGTLNENIPVIGGKGWGDAYGLGMSFAQSTMAAYTGGSTGALVQFFGSAAAAGVDDALSRGATADQAMLFGTMEGLAEGLAESIGVDNLFKIGSANTMRQLVANILKQGAAEGLEEGITSILNEFSDRLVMGDKSNFMARVEQYMASGMSEGDAKKQAWLDFAEDTAFDMLGGFATGFASGTLQTGIQTIDANKQAKQIYGSDPGALVSEALEIDPGNAFAQKMQGRVDSGKGLSGGQLNRLVEQNEAAMTAQDMQSIQAAAAQRLTELGETGDVNTIAQALTKQAAGQELSKAEKRAISNSKYGSRVANELNTENIRSGDYASGWAESIGTHRINAQEYGRMLQAAQSQQEAAETTGEQVAAEVQNEAQAPQVEPKVATVRENRTVAENATVKESLQVTEEISDAQEISDDGVTRQKSTGEEITPKKIVSIEDGKVMIQTDSGTVEVDDIEFGTRDMALLWHSATQFHGINASGANGVIRAYHGQQPVATYLHGAAQEFRNGYYNMESGGEHANKLTPAQREIIYELGQKAAGEIVAKAQAKATEAKKKKATDSKTERVGKVHFDRNGRTFDQKRETSLKTMEQLSKALGVEFYVYESYVNEAGKRVYKDANGNENHAPNGWFDPSDGSIHIDLNAGADGKGTMLFTVSHELTHFIREWSPAKFKVLANFLITQYGETDVSVNELVEAQIKKAKKNGRDISYDTAFEEVVADSMEAIMTDGNVVQFMAELKQQDKTLWQKICDWFKDLVNDLKAIVEAYKGYKPDSNEGRLVADMQDMITVLESLYAEALVDAGENFQAEKAEKNTTLEGDAKMSVREDFYSEVDSWDGKSKRTFVVGRTSDVLKNIGAKDSRIIWHGEKMARIMREHSGMTKEVIKQVPQILENPVVVLASKQSDSRLVIFGTVTDTNGTPVTAILELQPTNKGGQILDMQIIASAYGKDNTKGLVESSGLVYIDPDKKRTKNWMQSVGLQLPSDATVLGSVGSITYPDGKVKIESIPYGQYMQHAGKVEGKSTEAMDIVMDEKTESLAPGVLFSERTWTESDYVQEREKAAEEIAKAIGVSEEKAIAYIDSVNSIAKMIADDRVRLDYFSSPGRSSFVSNVEYGGSFDFSTLCKKRRLLTGTFTAIQKALPNTALTAEEILDIRNRMKKAGLEVSCGLCYVEGSRGNMGQFAKEFLKLYKQYYPDAWQPNMADVNTPDGIEWVRINHPECYEQYEYFWNHFGTLRPDDKNLFASQQKPKLYQLHTEYKGEILDQFHGDDVEEKNLNGGIRLQSFSDFEIVHLIDTMQIIMDMSRVGLAGQAYTKVPDFAWALGDTGLKINLSLIAKGVDENGMLIFDDVEGMPIAEAMKLRERYSKNVGTIMVAFNDEQLLAALADDRVDFIIPFHRSQWKKSQYEAMGLPAKTKDYTYMQNEKFIKPQFHEYRGRMVRDRATNYMPNEYWDFSKIGKENAENYLQMCARNNKRPKFYKILKDNGDGSYSLKADGSTDGYWKLLIDFKMYDNDGIGSPQMPVKPDFNMDEATRMLNEYSGGHSNFPVAQGIADSFVKEYKESHQGVKFSERDNATYAEIEEERSKLHQREMELTKRKREAENNPALLQAMDDYSNLFSEMRGLLSKKRAGTASQAELDRIEEIKTQREERLQRVADIQESLGLNAMTKEADEIRVQKEALRVASDEAWAREGAERENKAIEKAGLSAPEYFRKKALKAFNTTTNFNEAGYLLPDGKLLNFSGGERNHRYRDHREIGEIYEATQGAAALNRFLNDGNIRIMAESPGIDLAAGVEPTKEQYAAIKKFVTSHGTKERQFFVDFSDAEGRRAGNYAYDGYINADRVVNDIKYYFENGKVREQSSVASFLYSERDPELEKVNRVLQKENTELRHDVAYLKELLKLQKQVTGGTKFTKSSVEAAAGHLMKYADANGEKSELVPLLNSVYEYIAGSEELTWEGIKETAQRAVQWLQDHEQTRTDDYSYDQELFSQELLSQVYDSFWNVSTLYTVADKAQKEINRLKFDHIGRMNTLKNYHKEQTAKLKQEHREDLKRVRQEMRDREEAKLKKIQEQHRESKKLGAEKRSKAEMRRKIRRTVMDLNKILNKGDKKRNVKEDMKDLVSEALRSADILFTDNYSNEDMVRNGVGTDLTEQESKYLEEARSLMEQIGELPSGSYESFLERQNQESKLQSKLNYRMSKLQDVFTRERARLAKAQVSEVLGSLADAYKGLEDSEHGYISGAFHENVYQYLLALKGDVGGTIVKDMSLYQLEELHKAYTMVLTTVRNANKMFAANLKQTREQLGSQTIAEVQKAGGEHGLWAPGEDKISTFFWNNQKPVYAFERIGSETLKTLFENTRAGEDSWIQDMTEAREYYLAQIRKHKYDSWDFEKQYKFTSTSGIDFSLNLEQIMSLYAYSKREQAHDHLMKGGFVFDGNTEVQVSKMGVKMTYLNKTAKAHNVSPEILGDIVSKLTAEQKAFVDEMQDYLSTNMGGKGNEVSMQMYGVKLFNEKYYFPLRSAGQYMERAKEADLKKQQGQISIVNSGFTKATTPKSSNPVVLSGFMDVWADHVNEMSMYHSFVLPMEDFRRVYNYSSPNMETGRSISVNSVIQDAYGEAATGYIDQLYRDLNGGAVSDPRETPAKALMGKFKKAAVFASMSVVIQQPSAIGRAFAIIDPKYFIGGKVDHKRHKALWAELKQYAPVAAIKEMGYFDTGMGKSAQDFIKAKEYHGLKEKAAALITDGDYRDEVLGKAPALADELTWCAIWEAAKRETKAKNPKMDVKSEAFLQEAGKRFTEVITKTQVYDSVLSRSANMRSKGAFMNMWTAFMAEPTTTINMVEDALRKGKRGDKKYAAKAMGAVMTSVVINSVLVSLVYAMRDDDEDETFLEKYVQSFATEILDGINPITYYPFLKDIWSALQGFDIERADMSLITSLVEKFTKAVQVCGKDTDGMDEDELAAHNKELANAWWGVVDYATALAGIPVKNVRRDINGAVNMIHTISQDLTDRDTSWGSLIDKTWGDVKNTIPVVGWMPEATAADKLYKATVNGDTAYQKRLASSYKTENSLNNAIRKGLRANDSRIWEAAMAWNNNDLEAYKRIAKGIVAEGHFSQDNVVMAIQAEANAMLPKESESGTKAKGYFTAEKFAVAISQGNDQMAAIIKADLIETAQKNGKTAEEAEKSFASSAKSDLEELFVAKDINESDAIAALTTYCDYEQDDATETVTKWRAEKENGIAYDDIKDAFMDGEISEADARNMYTTYGGFSEEEATKKAAALAFEKEYGFEWSKRGDAYKSGEISASVLRNALMSYGEKTAEEADLQIQAYDWEAEGYENVTAAAVREYEEHCAAYKVPKDSYLYIRKFSNDTKNDVDANGKTIYYSAMKKVMAEIGAQNITAAQKDAIARSLGWAEKNIRKYKTW